MTVAVNQGFVKFEHWPIDEIDGMRTTLIPMIERAFEYSPWCGTSQQVWKEIMEGFSELLSIVTHDGLVAIVVLQRLENSHGKVMHGQIVAGKHREQWFDQMIRYVEAQGKHAGCVRTSITGRTGWYKLLRKHGYKVEHVTIGKDL